MEILKLILLICVGFISGFYGTTAGGGTLLIGRAFGAYLGAGFALKKGEGFAKLLFIIVVLITGIKLLIGS